MLKVDLHTHSIASPDGSIRPEQYRELLQSGAFAHIAITDHNTIELAQKLHQEIGAGIIVGEEIMTTAGEIIGLFLNDTIKPHQSPLETVQAIKYQGGIVYIPHPFETVRHGITEAALEEILEYIDVIEVHNGRAVFQNRGPQAAAWAKLHHKIRAASSDAHGLKGMSTTYTSVAKPLTQENFKEVYGMGKLTVARPPLTTLLYPKVNRFRKKIRNL